MLTFYHTHLGINSTNGKFIIIDEMLLSYEKYFDWPLGAGKTNQINYVQDWKYFQILLHKFDAFLDTKILQVVLYQICALETYVWLFTHSNFNNSIKCPKNYYSNKIILANRETAADHGALRI